MDTCDIERGELAVWLYRLNKNRNPITNKEPPPYYKGNHPYNPAIYSYIEERKCN